MADFQNWYQWHPIIITHPAGGQEMRDSMKQWMDRATNELNDKDDEIERLKNLLENK
jgi:hypothetical protein